MVHVMEQVYISYFNIAYKINTIIYGDTRVLSAQALLFFGGIRNMLIHSVENPN
uniref:Uncharacterized protein n=1 Tax=Solanum tuberosum TaxID=4113 RepID=M1CTV0_SOLTU